MKRWTAPLRDIAVFIAVYVAAQYICIFASALFPVAETVDAAPTAEASVRAAASAAGQRAAVISVCASFLAVAAVAAYRRRIYGRSGAVMHSRKGFDPRILLWGVVLLVSISVVIDPLLSHLPVPSQDYGRGGWTLLSVVVLAPVAEELLFRGLLLEMLRRNMGVLAAVVASSAVFAAMHLQPAVMIDAFLAGLALCYIYLLTRSIYACIILHMFNNAIAMSMQVLEYRDKTLGELIDSSSAYFIIYALALAAVAVGVMHAASTLRRASAVDKNPAAR